MEQRHLMAAAVVGRHVFYNESFFDANNAAIDAADDAAIDPGKSAYRPEATFSVRRLTDNSTFDTSPRVLGSQIIWQGRGGTDGGTDDEVFWFDGATTTQLTTNSDADRFPKISNLGMAWERGSGTGQEIIFHDGVSETPLTTNSVFDGAATLSDTRLAWEQGAGNGKELMSWDGVTTTNLSQNSVVDITPSASSDRVAWRSGSTPAAQILLHDGTTLLPPLVTSQFALDNPKASSDWVVWEGFAGTTPTTNDREIYLYDGSTVTRLTTNAFPDFAPQVSGQRAVWWGGVFNNFQVYYYDGGTVTPLSTGIRNQWPQIDGQNVVWQGYDGNDDEIFFWNGQEVIQLTDNSYNDTNPQISGNHVAWQGEFGIDGTTHEIFDAFVGDGAATFANITGYDKGTNGIMIDLLGGGDHANISADDFVFEVGNNNSPQSWAAAPAPSAISVRSGAGVSGSDRVEITWATGAIAKKWLQVEVLANGNTGLTSTDRFFWGNAVGGSGDGDTANVAPTNITDELGARNNPKGIGNFAPVTFAYDYSKDRNVNVTDQLISRNNSTSIVTQLVKIKIAALVPMALAAVGDGVSPIQDGGDAGIASALAATAQGESTQEVSLPNRVAVRLEGTASKGGVVDDPRQVADAADSDLCDDDDENADSGVDDDLLDALVAGLSQQ